MIYLPIFIFTDFKADRSAEPVALILGIPIAIIIMGPSVLIYSILMEFIVNPKISDNKYFFIISAFIGGILGIVLGWVGSIIGVIAGFICAFHLRRNYIKAVNNKIQLSAKDAPADF